MASHTYAYQCSQVYTPKLVWISSRIWAIREGEEWTQIGDQESWV